MSAVDIFIAILLAVQTAALIGLIFTCCYAVYTTKPIQPPTIEI